MTAPSRPAKVSVAMATYQGEAWIEEQLASLVGQTRPPDELVVCDDASRDTTVERVERFARSAPFPVRIERSPENLTTTHNFEKALSLCTGDLVLFADQDDVWLPDKVATLAGVLEAEPEVGLVFSDGRVVDAERRPLGHSLWQALWFDRSEQQRVRRGLAVEVFARHVVAAGTTLAFRARYRELVLPFPRLRHAHDAWVALLVAAVAPVRLVERPLLDYRVHGGNQFGLKRPTLREQWERAREQIALDVFDYAVRFFEAARARLAGRAPEATLAVLEEKIAHCRRRADLPPRLLARLPAIAAETASGRYRRFSYGWKSVAQDLVLRRAAGTRP